MKKPTPTDMTWLGRELRGPGRSQTALARHLGIDKGAVSRIISGKRSVKVEELAAIAEYLRGTDPEWRVGSADSGVPELAESRAIADAAVNRRQDTLLIPITSLFVALRENDDRMLVEQCARLAANMLAIEIMRALPFIDERAAEALLDAHRRHYDLFLLTSIAFGLGAIDEMTRDGLMAISELRAVYLLNEEPTEDQIRAGYVAFFRAQAPDVKASPRDDLSYLRPLFVTVAGSTLHFLVTGSHAETARLYEEIRDEHRQKAKDQKNT